MPGVTFVVNGSLVRGSSQHGSGHVPTLCGEAAKYHGWDADLLVTEKAEAGVTAASSAALDGVDLVVAVGGDGTVRGCAEGMAGTGVPLGIVPHGTANLLARTLGVPLYHPRAALHAALHPGSAIRAIDLAVVDGVPFTAMTGMGLDAAVVAGTRLKHQFGWLAYAMSGAAHLTVAPTRFTIRLDDGAPFKREARSVVVGNSGLLPGGFSLLPDARVDDGLLDVGVLAPQGALGWPRLATRVLTRSRHQDRMLERHQARRIEVAAAALLPREVDGELVPSEHAMTVTVRPGALAVRMPTGSGKSLR